MQGRECNLNYHKPDQKSTCHGTNCQKKGCDWALRVTGPRLECCKAFLTCVSLCLSLHALSSHTRFFPRAGSVSPGAHLPSLFWKVEVIQEMVQTSSGWARSHWSQVLNLPGLCVCVREWDVAGGLSDSRLTKVLDPPRFIEIELTQNIMSKFKVYTLSI